MKIKQCTWCLTAVFIFAFAVQATFAEQLPAAVFNLGRVPDFDLPYHAIAADRQGYIYLAGSAPSAVRATSGAYDTTYNGGDSDIFIAKFDRKLGTPLAVTLIGGKGLDLCRAMIVDREGNVIITGRTTSPDFPPMSNNAGKTLLKEDVAFVAQFDASLKHLRNSALLGPGEGTALALDQDGGLYVTGWTENAGFPVARSGHDSQYNGGESDVFIVRLSWEFSLLSATFLGGSGWELPSAIAVTKTGNVVLAGSTGSADFPVSAEAMDRLPIDRGGDGFVALFADNLNKLQAASFLGGNGHDVIHSMALDRDGNIYITGLTLSTDFPTTASVLDRTFNGEADVFVAKVDNRLKNLIASTYVGGGKRDWAFSMALHEDDGALYVAGETVPTTMPVDSQRDRYVSGKEIGKIFVMKLNLQLTDVKAGVLVGGEADERVPTIILDDANQILIAGMSSSSDYPPGAISEKNQANKGYHLFVSTVDWEASPDRQVDMLPSQTAAQSDGEANSTKPVTDHLQPLNFRLSIVRDGTGGGTVVSDPVGIECGVDCQTVFPDGTSISLQAEPAPDAIFDGWTGGGCRGREVCRIVLEKDYKIKATFKRR